MSVPWYPTKLNPKNGSSIVINARKCLVDNEEESPIFGKPDIILFYNATKRGVDTVDKYKESYSVARTTNRLSMTSFYLFHAKRWSFELFYNPKTEHQPITNEEEDIS